MTAEQVEALATVRLVHDAIHGLDVDGIVALPEPDALTAYAVIEDANRVLQQIRSLLTQQLAERMSDRQITVDGVGTFVRRVKKDRTQWHKDDLLRAVLDTRIVDETTGEITDPTPLDKVLHVWNLGAPRLGALKDRGIDPDEFCHVERRGYTIEVVA
jgi:hypothetical protein